MKEIINVKDQLLFMNIMRVKLIKSVYIYIIYFSSHNKYICICLYFDSNDDFGYINNNQNNYFGFHERIEYDSMDDLENEYNINENQNRNESHYDRFL